MKKAVSILFLIAFLFNMASCSSSEKSLYGTWYNDTATERNAIQFDKNDKNKEVFIWAIYDLEKNEVKSTTNGYYSITGDKITFSNPDSDTPYELTYSLKGDTLTLSSNGTKLILEKYTLK